MPSLTTPLKLTANVLASALFFAPNPTLAQSELIDGEWIADSLVSTGVLSDSYVSVVEPLAGTRVALQGQHLLLSENVTCLILEAHPDVWINDRLTFGSFGGNWADIGLKSTDGQHYHVMRYDVECPDSAHPQLSLVTQPDHHVLLLGSFRIFVNLLPVE